MKTLIKLTNCVAVALLLVSCAGESTQSTVKSEKSESFPKTISCYMALDAEAKSYSCNEFKVSSKDDVKLVATSCLLAGDLEALEAKVVDSECDRVKPKSLCHDVDDFEQPLKTYFYYSDASEKEKAKDACAKLDGLFEDISSIALTK